MKKVLLSALLGAVALGSIGLFAACGDDEPTTTPTPSYGKDTAVTDVADVEYTYNNKGDVTSWTQGAKLYTAKYLLKGDSASYVELAGAKPEELEIVGYHGAIDTLSVKDIENKVTIDGKAISVSGIKDGAFYGCSTLKSVDLSKKNKSLNFNIGARAFYNCTALTEFKFPEQVYSVGNSIGAYAFMGCAALTEINVPANFNNIGNGAFANCVELARVTLPDTVEIIPQGVFYMDEKLSSFSGAKNAKSIQENAFYGTALAGFNFANYAKLTYIGDQAFSNTLLTEVVVPQSVGYVGKQAFYNLESLTKVEVPFLGYNVANTYDSGYDYDYPTGNWTFEDNYGLSGLKETEKDEREIAVSVTAAVTINDSVFANCESVKSITITNFIAEGRYDVYDNEGLVKNRVEVEPNYVIGNNAFYNCHNLTALSLPQGVTEIGASAFQNCYNMESISLQSGLESIGSNALRNCRKLAKVELPDTVKEIGDNAFYGCRELTEMTFPASVTKLGTAVLGDCASLKSISIKKAWSVASEEQDDGSVTYSENQLTIGRNLFSMTEPSEFINADEMYKTSDSDYAYNIPASLTSLTIDGVKYIPDNAFAGMKELEKIELTFIAEKDVPDSYKTYYYRKNGESYKVTSYIGNSAFYDCRKLTAINVPDTATRIGNNAFYGCRELTSFTIPASVTTVGTAILGDCIKLKTLTVEKWDGLQSVRKDDGYGVYYADEYYTMGALNKLFSSTSAYRNEKWAEYKNSEDSDNNGTEYFYDMLSIYTTTGSTDGENASVYLPKSLTSVTVNSVCQVPQYAFNGWKYLQSVELTFVKGYRSDSYSGTQRYSHTPIIGKGAFYNCNVLNTITVEDAKDVKTVDSYAFYGCNNFTGKVFSTFDNVEYIGGYALANSSYSGTVTLPSTLTYIGTNLLYDCRNLTGLVIENYSQSYGDNINGAGYEGVVRSLFGSNITSSGYFVESYYDSFDGDYIYSNIYNLNTVTLKGVNAFAAGAMQYMSSVRTLTIEGDVNTVYSNNIFAGMTLLQTLDYTIPVAAYNNSNYHGILSGCNHLTALTVEMPSEWYMNSYAYLGHLFHDNGSNSYLPTTLTTVNLTGARGYYIPRYFLNGASNVTNVTFANSRNIGGIGNNAFTNCGAVTNTEKAINDGELVAGCYMLNGWVVGKQANAALYIPKNAYGIAYGILPESDNTYNESNRVYFEGTLDDWNDYNKSGYSWYSSYEEANLYVYDSSEDAYSKAYN